MGKVLQRAGGGKVTVEGLTADIVQAGKTVTVKQGSKVVQEVRGSYKTPIHVTNFECIGVSQGGYANLYFDISDYSHLVLSGWGNYSSAAYAYVDDKTYYLKTSDEYSSAGKNFSLDLDISGNSTLRIYLRGNNTARINSMTIT